MYRTRLVSTRIPEHAKRELAELARVRSEHEWDPDACRAMLFAVLETAIRDYEELEGDPRRQSRSPNRRAHDIVEDHDPREFFESSWFEQICYLLGLNHRAVRAALNERVNSDGPAPPPGAETECDSLRCM